MMQQKTTWLVLSLGAVSLPSCQTSFVPASTRDVAGISKAGQLQGPSRDPLGKDRPELYIKRQDIQIEPKEVENTTGSLFRPDDQRNFLYLSHLPFAVGQFLTVQVVPGRGAEEPDKTAKPDAKTKPGDTDASSGDATVKELLAALPQLDPGAEGGPKLMTKLKMKIAHVYENGDALAVLNRTSQRETQASEIDIRARIPYMSMVAGKDISTNDLVDVHWHESVGGEVTERYSSAWEDEYSLRLSGFNEAKSKYALDLESKRAQMDGVKDRLKNQLISIGKERQTLAKERQRLLDEKAQNDARVTNLEQEMEKQKSIIDEQKEQLDEQTQKLTDMQLTADKDAPAADDAPAKDAKAPAKGKPTKDKPGDAKDGAKGKK